jgi:archaellum component FlaC
MSSRYTSTEDEILRTLQSINRTAIETDQVSAATAEVVSAQGEQIQNIAKNADTIEENLNTSEWLIRGIKGIGGRLRNAISGPEKVSNPTAQSDRTTTESQNMSQSTVTKSVTESRDFDSEMNRQLDQISSVLGNIHARSLELSDNISRQVKTVESVDSSVAKSMDRMQQQHKTIKYL